ncbi:hypothetical protein K501DRAFT_266430 [Backusella circina FSU 941]|nr:hypothetical protein K501DRAFT_266430 [Backusella circina FSU 941]
MDKTAATVAETIMDMEAKERVLPALEWSCDPKILMLAVAFAPCMLSLVVATVALDTSCRFSIGDAVTVAEKRASIERVRRCYDNVKLEAKYGIAIFHIIGSKITFAQGCASMISLTKEYTFRST